MVENESIANHSAMGRGWKYKMGLKPGHSPRKCEGWCRKENVNEEHWQMQQQNEDQHHQNLLGVLPSKYHRREFLTFDFKKWLQN